MSGPQMFVPFQPKSETRKGGKFEDVTRPNQQTTMHGLLRFGQIMLILLAVFAWGKVAEAYQAEAVTGRLSELMTGAIWFVTLILVGVAYAVVRSKVDADAVWTGIIITALLIVWAAFNVFIAPVAVFAMVMTQHNLLYVLPIIVTAAAAAFVPSFEVGRHSFWRELVDQSGTNSEKPVLDETAITIEQMKIDFAREQAALKESALRAEVERLQAMIKTPQAQVIDGEPTFAKRKSIEDCIRPVKINGHWEYEAVTRGGPRRLDSTLLVQFVVEAWAYNKFERRYWLERGLKRDDWEAMRGAVAWALDDANKVIRGVDDVLAEMMRFGVISPALYPTPPVENGLSQSRP